MYKDHNVINFETYTNRTPAWLHLTSSIIYIPLSLYMTILFIRAGPFIRIEYKKKSASKKSPFLKFRCKIASTNETYKLAVFFV